MSLLHFFENWDEWSEANHVLLGWLDLLCNFIVLSQYSAHWFFVIVTGLREHMHEIAGELQLLHSLVELISFFFQRGGALWLECYL